MFALIPLDENELSINLKCEPEQAVALREKYAAVKPGYHMNKTHWNTVMVDGSIGKSELLQMVDHSYDLIVKSLTRKQQEALREM